VIEEKLHKSRSKKADVPGVTQQKALQRNGSGGVSASTAASDVT
jgi:hypothetical protein